MKKFSIYFLAAVLIFSISFIGLTGETTINDLLERIEDIETRLSRIEEKMGEDFEVPEAAKTYNIQDRFELSRFQLRSTRTAEEALGEIKALDSSYSTVRFNLILYDEKGKILETARISIRDIDKDESRTFTETLYDLDNVDNVNNFKLEIDSTR